MSTENTSTAPETTSNEPVESNEASETQDTAAPTEVKAEIKDAKEALKDPNLSKVEKKEIKQKIRELTLKVDGKTYKESIPFDVEAGSEAEEYLKRQLQMAKMGNNRAQYAKSLESEVADFFQKLKDDPRSVLSDPNIGVDLKKFANSIIEEEIANSKKSPEQLEKEKLQKELKQIRDEREKEKKDSEQRELERLTQTAYQNYETNIIKTIDTAKDLPKSAYVVKKFADFMVTGLQMGADLSPEDVLPLVRAEISNDIKQMFSASPDEMLEAMLGKDRIAKMRKKSIEKAKINPQTAPLKGVRDVANPNLPKKEEPKINYKQFFKL